MRKATITIMTTRGLKEVTGYIYRGLHLRHTPRTGTPGAEDAGWHVTHIPSGKGINPHNRLFKTRSLAQAYVDQFLKSGTFDPKASDPVPPADIKDILNWWAGAWIRTRRYLADKRSFPQSLITEVPK